MHFQQRVENAETPSARRALLVFDHQHDRDRRIGEQLEEPGAALVDAGADRFDQLLRLIALGGALGEEALRLSLKGWAILRR